MSRKTSVSNKNYAGDDEPVKDIEEMIAQVMGEFKMIKKSNKVV